MCAQGWPPFPACVTTVRERAWNPPPHDFEQVPQAENSDSTQSFAQLACPVCGWDWPWGHAVHDVRRWLVADWKCPAVQLLQVPTTVALKCEIFWPALHVVWLTHVAVAGLMTKSGKLQAVGCKQARRTDGDWSDAWRGDEMVFLWLWLWPWGVCRLAFVLAQAGG